MGAPPRSLIRTEPGRPVSASMRLCRSAFQSCVFGAHDSKFVEGNVGELTRRRGRSTVNRRRSNHSLQS